MKLLISIGILSLTVFWISCEKGGTSGASAPIYNPPSVPVVNPQTILRSHPWKLVRDSVRVIPHGPFVLNCCGGYLHVTPRNVVLSGNYTWEFRTDNKIYGYNSSNDFKDTSVYLVSGTNVPFVLTLSNSTNWQMESPYKIISLTNDLMVVSSKLVNPDLHEMHRLRTFIK